MKRLTTAILGVCLAVGVAGVHAEDTMSNDTMKKDTMSQDTMKRTL